MAFTITEVMTFEEDIKKSRFQAIAIPVEDEADALQRLADYKDISASHQCWAWKVGHNIRLNDDGEPSGTAAKPILATIEGNDLTNILVIVNRWYGGVKLGTGGLVRAYGGCAGKCLALVEKVELVEKKQFQICCTFSEWPIFQYELSQLHAEHAEDYQSDGVMIDLKLQVHQVEDLNQKLQDLTRGRETLKELD